MIFRTPLVLVLIPIVIGFFIWHYRRREDPSFRFSSVVLTGALDPSWKARFAFIPGFIRLGVVILFLIALAGPQSVIEESKITAEGIDIMLAVDCSGSMAAEDFTLNGQRINRLEVVKNAVAEFIAGRHSDKIGFIAFSAKAYMICPLTTDYNWLNTNLSRVRLGMIQDGTAIGSAIATSVARLKNSQAKSKVLILLTDGISNAGSIDPLSAARLAQASGVKIYTIGAGTKGFAPYPVQDFFGRTVYQNVKIDIDEDVMKKISAMTNGKYFRATDTDSLRNIYKEIDSLEKTKIEEIGYRQYKELFVYVLAAALVLLLFEILLVNTLFLKIP